MSTRLPRADARPRPLAGLAVLCLTLSAPADARAPLQEPAEQALPAASRVIELESGDFLRARARRLEDGRWQALLRGDWTDLQGVRRATDERELLARAKQLEREVSEPVHRVALADWMARQGLGEEALRQLDRVLASDPEQPDALKLLAAPPRALDVHARSEDADQLFDHAVRGGPALRELALARLAEVESQPVLFERLREGLASHSFRTRVAAARGLGAHFPGEELRGLVTRSVLDGSDDVRQEAARALGRAQEPAVILPLVRALGSEHAAVRTNAIEALGHAGYPAAVAPLMTRMANLQSGGGGGKAPAANVFVGRQVAYIQDFDVEVAQNASVADPVVNVLTEGSVLDVRVQGMTTYTAAAESRSLRSALERLTGTSPGRTDRAWLAWWEDAGRDWH